MRTPKRATTVTDRRQWYAQMRVISLWIKEKEKFLKRVEKKIESLSRETKKEA